MSLYNEKLLKLDSQVVFLVAQFGCKLAEKEWFSWFVEIAWAELGKMISCFKLFLLKTIKKLKTFIISPPFLMINEYTPA